MDRKDLLSFIPLMTGVLIIIGFLRSVVFYNFFNIKINDFIGLNEILILFLDEVFYFLIMMIPLIYSVITDYYKDKVDENEGKSRFNIAKSPKERKFLLTTMVIVYLLILAFVSYLALFTDDYTVRIGSVCFLIILITSYIYIKLRNHHYKAFGRYPTEYYFYASYILLLFGTIVCTNTAYDATLVDEGRYEGTTIVTNDTTYNSNKESFYIGKTDRYVFMHDKLQDKSTAIPMSEVIQLDIKNNMPSTITIGIKKSEVDTSIQKKTNINLILPQDSSKTLNPVIPQ